MIEVFLNELKNLQMLELIGVLGGLLYTILAARQLTFCWIFGGISTLAYTILFLENKVFINSALNLYYTAIAIYGWIQWNKISQKESSSIVKTISTFKFLVIVLISVCLTPMIGYIFQQFTDHPFPYIDSLVSLLSVAAAFLAARKVIHNWLLWILADSIALYMFFELKLYFTCFLFLVYIANAIYAWFSWSKSKILPES